MFNFRKFVLIFLAFITCPANSYKMIVLTGGPCAGKSTSLSILKEYFSEDKNYIILTLDEIATSLISKGITPNTLPGGAKEFQKKIFEAQIEGENILRKIATILNNWYTVLIICDRGLLDGLAYMDEEERDDILRKYKLTIKDVYNRYDLVIHLRSFANSESLYSERKENRWENQEQAKELDGKLYNLWKDHKNFVAIDDINKGKKERAKLIYDEILSIKSKYN